MKKYQDAAEIVPPQKSRRKYRVYPALIEACAQLEAVTTPSPTPAMNRR
jgi:hypothetical protein